MKKLTIGFIGNFQVPYTTENDRKWSFEKLGHTVIPFQENQTTYNQIMARAKELDVLIYSHTHGWEIQQLRGIFEAFKKYGIPTVSVHLDRWAWLDREKDMGQEATWFTEYQFMADGSPEAIEQYEKLGLKWFWLKPGVVERDCYLAQPDRSRFPHDIIFVGSKGYHAEYPQRKQLIEWLQTTFGDRFGHYGGDGISGTIRGHDLNTLYASAKVVVGDSCFGGRPLYWSDRVTETIGRGGFLIHPHCEGLDIPGLVNYTSGDYNELEQIINYWLGNDKGREENRITAHEFVKKHETYTNRSQQMLDIIFKGKDEE